MVFKSVLSVIGKDVKKVFTWIGSPQGQAVIASGEAVAVAVDPALAGLVPLFNTWMKRVVTVESLAAAAGEQDGSGVQKASAVLSDVTPAVLAYAKDAGLPQPTADQIAKANDAVVAFLNAFAAQPAA